MEEFQTPSSLRVIEAKVFSKCDDLTRVVLNDGLETLGKNDEGVFEDGGLEEIVIPKTLKKISKNAFRECEYLVIVWVEDGFAIDIKPLVESANVFSK